MNFKLTSLILAILYLCNAVIASNVIVATDKNFNEIVLNSGKTSFVKFYADWCSHCKRMAPAFEELADIYSKSDDIQIVEINGDENRKITNRYDIEGFPSLKIFVKDNVREPIEYQGGRDTESFENFIVSTTGVKVYKPKLVSYVKSIDDNNFDKDVLGDDRAHFFVFTASWCGHCKNLKPQWAKLAEIFSNDNDTVVIGEILTTDVPAEELKERFHVQGFPTIYFFNKGERGVPETYQGGRDLESLVSFVNEKTGLERDTNGQLTEKAGLIQNFDVSNIISSEDKITRAQEMLKQLEEIDTPDVAYYKKLLNKIIADQEGFFNKETARLEKILSKSENLAQSKIDSIKKRLNVLKSFLQTTEEAAANIHDEF